MLKPGVGGTGIDQKRMTELTYITKPLKCSRIDELRRPRIYADVVPEGIADG
jgi:hypothetical protein